MSFKPRNTFPDGYNCIDSSEYECRGDKIAIIDVDTLLYNAALAAQEPYVIVKNKQGKEKEFRNQTEFFGHYSKKDGGWLAEQNAKRVAKGLEPISADEYEITHHVRLVSDGEVSPEVIAKGRFKRSIQAIMEQPWCKDIIICYGRGTNFRHSEAHTQAYKSNRADKPLLLKVVTEYMEKRYADKIVYGDNCESDDVCYSLAYKAWLRSGRNFDNLDVVLCAVDKDAKQCPCDMFNYNAPDQGLTRITPLEAATYLGEQMLKGDSTDTIKGLPQLPPELCTKYNIRKSKTIGDTTATNYLKGCVSPTEVFERVVEAYRAYYGDEKKEFTSFRGEVLRWNWLDYFNEALQLLRMRVDYTTPNVHGSGFLLQLRVKVDDNS
jgi:hypothetical protein